MTPPTSKSARTNDIPRVLRPGKRFEFTGVAAKPVVLKFPADFMPENVKSLIVRCDEFLQELGFDFEIGMQKSFTGSGSEPKITQHLSKKINNRPKISIVRITNLKMINEI